MLCAYASHAAYLSRVPVTVQQPDGTIIHCLATGDEFHNWLHDKENFTIVQDPQTGYYVYAVLQKGVLIPSQYVVGRVDPASTDLTKGVNLSPQRIAEERTAILRVGSGDSHLAPRKGQINQLVIFIRFSDDPAFAEGIQYYDSLFNARDPSSLSEYNYFREVSYQQLIVSSFLYPLPSGSATVSYKDTYPRGYFLPYNSVTNPLGYRGQYDGWREDSLLRRAINAIKAQVPSDLALDGDNDGNVDNICFIVYGKSSDWGTLLWPHAGGLYAPTVLLNGKTVGNYTLQISDLPLIQMLSHELLHILGAPDLYHYSFITPQPVGGWDIMEGGQGHTCAYMKWRYLQWISSIPEITATGIYSLSPLTSATNNCYSIASPRSSNEYFVVEYRQQSGPFESLLPGSGLLVYRIDRTRDGFGNASGPPDELYLYRPDGTTTVNGSLNIAYFSSPAGRTSINDGTNPSSFLSDGSPGGLDISLIGTPGATISFKVTLGGAPRSVALTAPVGGESVLPGTTFQITWNSLGVDSVRLDYTTDAGGTWSVIQSLVVGTPRQFGWTVPNTPSRTCMVRVTAANDPSVSDTSRVPFEIIPLRQNNTVLVSMSTLPQVPSGVDVRGNYAYVADFDSGLRIFNIIDPSAPYETGSFIWGGLLAWAVCAGDGYVCIANGSNGLWIVGVQDPSRPDDLAFYQLTGVCKKIKIRGQLAYVAAAEAGLRVLDLSNPSQPREIGYFDTPGSALDLALRDSIVVVADYSGGVRLINAANPAQPVEIGHYETDLYPNVVDVTGNLLCVADNRRVDIVDIQIPSQPQKIASLVMYDTWDATFGGHFAYLANDTGLTIVNVENPHQPTIVGSFRTAKLCRSVAVRANLAFFCDDGHRLFIVRNELSNDGDVPRPIAPATMVAGLDTPVTVRWTRPAGATSFHLQVGGDSTFTSGPVLQDYQTVDTFAVLHSLSFLTSYWWHVRAYNAAIGVSAYSEAWTFSTGLSLPGVVSLVEPSQNAVVNADTLRLRWRSTGPFVDRYWMEYSIDSAFTMIGIDSLLTDTTAVIRSMIKNMEYYWRVRAHNLTGWGPYSSRGHFLRSTTAVKDLPQGVPSTWVLLQNYPNPFNPSTTITFGLPQRGQVRLTVYNTLGEEVASLVEGEMEAGYHTVRFDASGLSSGVYFYRIEAGSFVQTRKLLVLR